MVRGCQKRTVHIRDTGSKYYEEAFFILRPGALEGHSENDMIEEAMRIAEKSLRNSGCSGKKKKICIKSVALFGAGFASGALGALAVCLIIFL